MRAFWLLVDGAIERERRLDELLARHAGWLLAPHNRGNAVDARKLIARPTAAEIATVKLERRQEARRPEREG